MPSDWAVRKSRNVSLRVSAAANASPNSAAVEAGLLGDLGDLLGRGHVAVLGVEGLLDAAP